MQVVEKKRRRPGNVFEVKSVFGHERVANVRSQLFAKSGCGLGVARSLVIPAKSSASRNPGWIPVFAGMTNRGTPPVGSGLLRPSVFQTHSKDLSDL